MNPRTLIPAIALGLLAAASGCASNPLIRTLPSTDSGKPATPILDHATTKSATPTTGTPNAVGKGGPPPVPSPSGVQPAGFVTQASNPPAVPTVNVPPLPTPAVPPIPTGQPTAAPAPNTATSPVGGVPTASDPHVRNFPTAAGAIMNLAPNEVPADRVLEIARQLEVANNANRILLDRIKQLEAAAVSREQALDEAVRDVEVATSEIVRTRADLQALRAELASVRTKLAQVEKEDIETLKAVIAVLEKLLAPPRRKEAP